MIIPPYGSAVIQARICSDVCSNTYCISPCVKSAARSDALVKTEIGDTCFWLTNNDASPIDIEKGQVVGKAEVVVEVYTSSDILAADVLEELIAQSSSIALCAFGEPAARPHASTREERMSRLVKMVMGEKVELTQPQLA